MPMDRLPDVEVIVHVHDDPIPLVRLDERTRELVVHGVYLAGVPIGSRRGGRDVECVLPGGLPSARDQSRKYGTDRLRARVPLVRQDPGVGITGGGHARERGLGVGIDGGGVRPGEAGTGGKALSRHCQ